MAGCCNSIARCLLILFNILFWLSGAALLGLGIWFKVDKNINSYLDVIEVDTEDPYFDYAVYVLIAFGAFVFLVGFCGCCGAVRESKCLLGFYIFFLMIIIGGEIAAAVFGFLYKDKVETKVTDLLMETMEKYKTSKNVRNAWDFVQIELDCCGSDSPETWKNLSITYYYNAQGCKDGLKDLIMEYNWIIFGVAIGIAFLEVIGIVFAFCVCREINKDD
uniref:Tetraspanin n=1 Tax=Magallana gigas TaxID=29159 RepID=K1RU12_MAGGI